MKDCRKLQELRELAKNTDTTVMSTYFVNPKGGILQYTRIVDNEYFQDMKREVAKFYTDDLFESMMKGLKNYELER